MITQLDTENADRDLTSQVTVLTHTPDTSNPMLCQGLIFLGDGTKNLDGSGGNFELTITVGGQTIEPDPQIITFSTATRVAVWTSVFPVPANNEVILKVKSPNTADTDVDATAYLYESGISAASINAECDTALSDVQLDKAAKSLVNKAVQNKATGAIEYYDDDGETIILTHTPSDGESAITRMPS
jgi:hypothetical protein